MDQARPPAAVDPASGSDPGRLLEEAFSRWQSELLGTLVYLVGNLADAQDALQETFLKCWRHRGELGRFDNLKAWVFRVAVNTGRDLRGTAWRRRRYPLPGDEQMPAADDLSGPALAERSEQLARLQSALADLRAPEQEVFLLRQNSGCTYEEIAQLLGIPCGTAKTRMRLALEKLRAALADR